MADYLLVLCKLGRKIRTSKTYWDKIVSLKHPSMLGKVKQVTETLENPEIVKKSKKDAYVCLYYRKMEGRYICVVVKHENGTGYIVSFYPVDKIKKGETVYEKNKIVS